MAAFMTEEWAWVEVYRVKCGLAARGSPAVRSERRARSRAATIAVNVASLAVPRMTPPPAPPGLMGAGRASRRAIHPTITVSTSVQAGLVDQSMPCCPRPAESSSPSTAGALTLQGKYP